MTLNVAARYAQYTNFADNIEEFVHKSEVLRKHCDDVGTDFDAITRTAHLMTICEETEKDVEERIGWIKNHLSQFVPVDRAEKVSEAYRKMAGTPEQLVEKLRRWEEVGMTYPIAYFAEAGHDSAGLERFAREVIHRAA